MSYAAILVHAETAAAAARRLDLAADLANQFGAALIGLGAETFEQPSAAAAVGYMDGATMVAEAEAVQDDLKLAEARFREASKAVKAGAEWRSGVGMPYDMLVHEARAADLIVSGPRRSESWGLHNIADPGDLVMNSGRPVLVVPLDLERLDASSIVVAWKDTREARRAVADALPFLKRARTVLVAGICEDRAASGVQALLDDVAGYLARHGVKASTAARPPSQGSAVRALVEIAHTQEAGLIVAGGYGHPRLREWAFGGVTQALLSGCGHAVLLSH